MINKIIKLSRTPILGILGRFMLIILGCDIPEKVKIGKNVKFVHRAIGVVIHESSKIEDNVKIYQNVTLGRADIYLPYSQSEMKGIIIKEGACICAGAKVLCKTGVLTVGKNSVIAANAVLLESTGENEIWGGIPAKKIGIRKEYGK